jgi:hypothetical protein
LKQEPPRRRKIPPDYRSRNAPMCKFGARIRLPGIDSRLQQLGRVREAIRLQERIHTRYCAHLSHGADLNPSAL